MNYTQLSLSERYQISALKGARQSIKYIADQLNRSPKNIRLFAQSDIKFDYLY